MQNRTLYFGDNLEILREKFPDRPDGEGYFDLIYLDPPFNSNRDYNMLFREGLVDDQAQRMVFEDSWHWTQEAQQTFEELVGTRKSKIKTNEQIINLMLALDQLVKRNDMLAYLTMMTARLMELHRVLKSTGSIYLHCDPTASHYLKIVMDAIFGKHNFLNELIWRYEGPQAPSRIKFATKHDVILRYAKSIKVCKAVELYYFEKIPAAEANFKKDENGKYFYTLPKGDYTDESIKKLEGEGRIYRSSRGTVRIKYFVEKTADGYFLRKKKIPDVWDDISSLGLIAQSKEVLGYPTQKPEALLERIIKASSNEGDWALDPFCGCGTTVSVAERLGRNWVGIDVSMFAVNLIKKRIREQFAGKLIELRVDGLPKDLAGARALFKKDPFDFEAWALDLVTASPSGNKKRGSMRGADKGIDGIITFTREVKNGVQEYGRLLVQVKGGGVGRSDIATLKGDMEREKADGGLFITLEEPTRPMREEAVSAGSYHVPFGNQDFPRMQIISIKELLTHRGPRVPFGSPEPYHKKAKRVEPDMSKHQRGMGF